MAGRRDGAVRMGLHTGEAMPVNDRYVGLDVHRAARIASAGHGGQILISATTARLAEEGAGVALVDLGQHRLKDLPAGEHIFQAAATGLASRFPPLQSIDAACTNLLDKVSSFVGRETEVGEVGYLLRDNRLVTLIGPGGSGKTRLAIRVGKRSVAAYPNGVWMIPLAPVTSEQAIAQAGLDALGLHEQPGRALSETLVDFLETRAALVLFDNCEHVLTSACQLVARIIERCPRGPVLATSREPLRVAGERVFQVPPLEVPVTKVATVADLAAFDSVRLFVERAPRPGLDSVSTRRTRPMSPIWFAGSTASRWPSNWRPPGWARCRCGQIASRLEHSFEWLRDRAGTAEARHRTLAAAVAWSHDLLSPEEQIVLRRLSVFRGTFDLDAAEYVAAGGDIADRADVTDLIATLVERSLVVAEGGTGGYRYRLLEVVRHYAADRLNEADEEVVTRDRLSEWVGRQVGAALWPLNPTPGWYTERLTDYHNVEAAHDWLLQSNRTAAAIEMAVALGWFWYNEGHWTEGRTRVASSLALPDPGEPLITLRAQALVVAALLAFRQGDYQDSLDLSVDAERLAGDAHPTLQASAWTARALALVSAERVDEASELIDTVLTYARAEESEWFLGAVLIAAGRVALGSR